MSRGRKRNSIAESFVAHSKEMRESPAWAALPDKARRVLDRLELEHMRHGGAENGFLPCTFDDFEEAGIRRKSVAPAIRQAVALGFVRVTRQGRPSLAEFRTPSLYHVTYLLGCGRSMVRTDDWKRVGSPEDAQARLAEAAQTRSEAHVRRAKQRTVPPTRDIESRGSSALSTVGAFSPLRVRST